MPDTDAPERLHLANGQRWRPRRGLPRYILDIDRFGIVWWESEVAERYCERDKFLAWIRLTKAVLLKGDA